MEFFREPKIDWLGIKWYFIGLTLALVTAGMVSVVLKGGLAYGIDFRGGTLVYVKFAQTPDLDAIRRQLDGQKLGDVTLQSYGQAADHEVIIGLDMGQTASSEA